MVFYYYQKFMALRALLSRFLGRFAPIFYFICKNKIHRASPCKQITKKNFADFQNFQKSNFDRGKFLKILSFINFPWDHMMSHKKFGPDRFSRFDVYWIQTDKQTNKQTSQIYIQRWKCTNFNRKKPENLRTLQNGNFQRNSKKLKLLMANLSGKMAKFVIIAKFAIMAKFVIRLVDL